MSKALWVGFVNIRLQPEHKQAIKERAKAKDSDKQIVLAMTKLVDDGYGLSINPDPDNGSMIATITGKDAECTNPGLAMSQRHGDPIVALHAVIFAHYDLAQGEEWEKAKDNGEYWDW
jgi:hypothetical protein